MAKQQSNKISTSNSFEDGLVADLHGLISPKNTYSDAVNMELITEVDNQYIFQDIVGDEHIVDFPKTTDKIGGSYRQYVPVGVKSRNNIAYILLGAFGDDGEFLMGAIGTFPSPNWNDLNNAKTSLLTYKYSHLHNFKKDTLDSVYIDPFESVLFNFTKNEHIDIVLQGDFDESANIIFSDSEEPIRIINSRFKRVGTGNVVVLADRLGENDSNTYSEDDWDRIALIQNGNFPIKVEGPEVIRGGGYLRGGGYRYYFKYTTQEGNTTDVLYESPLIPISADKTGLTKDQISNRAVRFILTGLDNSYSGIKVYFAHFDGATAVSTDVFVINYDFSYAFNASQLVITHTGLESVSPVDISEINTFFTSIDSVESITTVSDRLAIANTTSALTNSDVVVLVEAAKLVTLTEQTETIKGGYDDPELASKKLGYWKGEVYEFAVVFLLTNKGLSPAFPITGMDNIDAAQSDQLIYVPSTIPGQVTYPNHIIDETTGFSATDLINNKGLFRTANQGKIYEYDFIEDEEVRHITYLSANTSSFQSNEDLKKICSGFFIVRRRRVKNVLMQGMAVPTLKMPSKANTIPERVKSYQYDVDATKRYLMAHAGALAWNTPPGGITTIGLNAPYETTWFHTGSSDDSLDKSDQFNLDFDVVFVPQPTQIINTITYEKSWAVTGSIGQETISTYFKDTVDRAGATIYKRHIAFYSPEIDLSYGNIDDALSGISPYMEVQDMYQVNSPVFYTYSSNLGKDYISDANLVINNLEPIDMGRADWTTVTSDTIVATLLNSGTPSFQKNSFSASTDRALGFLSKNDTTNVSSVDPSSQVKSFCLPFVSFSPYALFSVMGSTSRYGRAGGDIPIRTVYKNSNFRPYTTIGHNYSAFLGIEIDSLVQLDNNNMPKKYPVFNYHRNPVDDITKLDYTPILPIGMPNITDIMYVNGGHLANVFRSGVGRWEQSDIVSLYKYDSNGVYHGITDRVPLATQSIDIYRGDGFISRVFKRTSYKLGVPESQSATAQDASNYGLGLLSDHDWEDMDKDGTLPDQEKFDKGRGLFDVGQIIEIISYSNINADIRSTEHLSDADSLLAGGDRNFYPNKQDMFGDRRPDSTEYNHGYTGDEHILIFGRLEQGAPTYNTEFPNRVLISEKNLTQNFFNSFRNIKGFNFRDYGIDLGPIIKIIDVKNLLLTIHRNGVLAIGIDDKTLLSEGSDVVINTAEVLSPTAVTISNVYGSIHKESVVKTATTVVGVDYAYSAVWLFSGDKLSVISELSVKSILEEYKRIIEEGDFDGAVPDEIYNPRVYSSYNYNNHAITISYVAEDMFTREQFSIGTVVYNTSNNKWVTRMSVGNKFSMSIGSETFNTGFEKTGISGEVGIWQYGALVDGNGNGIASRFRGLNFGHEFEITLNDTPTLEKILDNIQMITNKSVPVTIEYVTSGDINDAAVDIWGDEPNPKKFVQPIVTRNKSPRKSLRLGILDENAYYKNSNLYIEVGRINSITRKALGTRRIRDKSIKVRFIYQGNDRTFIQGIISILSLSYS